MRYQFIEIKKTVSGEIAYVMDTLDGKVLRMIVEDYTPERNYDDEEEYIAPIRMPDRKMSNLKKKLRPIVETYDETPETTDEVLSKPKPAMIPPQLRGVFIGQDSPGAAVETRRV